MLMENPPPARGGRGPAGPPAALPKHDAEIVDGQKITLGDLTVTPVAVPGHTPGSMAFLFPVKDRGATHMAALFGGAWLTPNILSDQALETFAASVAKFRSATSTAKVDTLLQNHMLMVPIQEKLDQLANRKTGERNPFVVGTTAYQKFVGVMAACTNVNLARRKP
jgi:metallo-beta-lactamase class B